MVKSKKPSLKITLIGSRFGRKPLHTACLKGLGLRRIHQSVVIEDTPCVRGMINRVSFLLKVMKISELGE